MHRFLDGLAKQPRKYTILLAVQPNSQENDKFSWQFKKSATELYFLDYLFKLPRKYYISWQFNFS